MYANIKLAAEIASDSSRSRSQENALAPIQLLINFPTSLNLDGSHCFICPTCKKGVFDYHIYINKTKFWASNTMV
ncbi:hypothetical protein RO3G_05660 [Rhizopus delemar RA 99-880]|uniref:Uncharacterized protein n=1 Tax=Rhizopus delemar (strain RA 99-880 / ATCC MYA-4621 / FGSC 9543 / NRRL 43880) TaxID=246409 RepID=I1BXM5_RHIO9|nr:hypothetical protein RO3G_05660 [Rhizopus delemar RA 99-880]|eukprot:EIE80955.1 hypothetical protein RO3G_05660 [Rhizopus delemar RA 99-880]